MQIKPYSSLITQIGGVLSQAKKQAISQINQTMVKTYRTIGQYIVEYEQGGSSKSEYGSALLQSISNDLTAQFGKGFTKRNLELMRQFYLNYPKTNTPSSQFKLSRSHYIMLMRMEPKERNFYEIESITNNRSLRELKRQFESALYERVALSSNKKGVLQEALDAHHTPRGPEDIIKDPYVLEFLGIKEEYQYSESQMEQAIIDKLEQFLLELGKGFAFIGRQQRFTFDERHFFVDLVFYNRLLQCFVLVDLKIGDLKHQDLGQMQMYVNYYDRFIKTKSENPTIGILLCKDKSDSLVEITLPEDSSVFASQYQLYLPDKQKLKQLLEL